MTFGTKIGMYWLVASRAVIYFVQTLGRMEPWEWMYRRVCNPKSRDYENKTLVWLLLSQAWREREHIRVLATYRDFEEIVSGSWNDQWRARILAAIDDLEAVHAGSPEPESERDLIIHRDYRPRH